ncbi:MAG: transcription antitermination factor NusB [Clostridia bacterium]|nr:transcription antitermination factor NusB [Clostridia bacterium]
MKRRELREHAFKLIFSGHDGVLPEEGVAFYLADNEIKGKDAKELTEKVNLVFSNLTKVDETIATHVKGYAFDRISKVSLAVLRLAVAEMLFDDSVPDGVAVSEAMAIAETFEDEKSKTFVNGVLGAVSRGKE